MPPPWIQALSPAPVPRRWFPFTHWYRGKGRWYYQGPGFCASQWLPAGEYERIDPALRRLCRLLHAQGLATTPSCQGHFYPPHHFRRIWHVLTDEARRIRGRGLVLRDAQDGSPRLFADPRYVLPWPDEEAFVREAQYQQQEGYLGVVVPHEKRNCTTRLLALNETGAAHVERRILDNGGQSLIDIHVHPNDPPDLHRRWASITEAAVALLRA